MEDLKQKILELKLESQDDLGTLNSIVETVKTATLPKDFLVPLLCLLENNPTFNFGMPGEVVRTIEKYYQDSDYFDLIIQSVERVPTEYNLWLMNRVMNTFEDREKIKKGLAVFHKVKQETNSNEIREIAQEFIENFDE